MTLCLYDSVSLCLCISLSLCLCACISVSVSMMHTGQGNSKDACSILSHMSHICIIYKYIHKFINTCIRVCLCAYGRLRARARASICVGVHACVYARMRACVCMCIRMRASVCMCVYVCVYVCACVYMDQGSRRSDESTPLYISISHMTRVTLCESRRTCQMSHVTYIKCVLGVPLHNCIHMCVCVCVCLCLCRSWQ